MSARLDALVVAFAAASLLACGMLLAIGAALGRL